MRKLPSMLLPMLLAAGPALAVASASTAQLSWMAGCWALVGADAGSGEQWTAPAGGVMLGVSRTLRQGSVREFEFLRIQDTAQGVVLVALPSGQKETTFAAERIDARLAVFHNPNHDFPQRVAYEALDANTLEGRIEGLRNGQPRVIRFPMKRASCPLGAAP